MAKPAAAGKVQVGRTAKFSVLDAKGSKVKHVVASPAAGDEGESEEIGGAQSRAEHCLLAICLYLPCREVWPRFTASFVQHADLRCGTTSPSRTLVSPDAHLSWHPERGGGRLRESAVFDCYALHGLITARLPLAGNQRT